MKRLSIPETWFAAFLFPFKLHSVLGAVWLFTWYCLLPPRHADARPGTDDLWYSAAGDFALVAHYVGIVYFIAAGVLWFGGMIQLFKYSRPTGIWSMAFGIFAFAAGMAMAFCVSEVNEGMREHILEMSRVGQMLNFAMIV